MYGHERPRPPRRRERHLLHHRLQRAGQPAGRAGGPRRRGAAQGHLPLQAAPTSRATAPRAQLLASGVAMPAALKAQQMLADEWGVAADVWSVTSWNELRRDARRGRALEPDPPGRGAALAVRHPGAARSARVRSSRSATTCGRCRTRSRPWVQQHLVLAGHRRVRLRRHPGRGPPLLPGRRRVDRGRHPGDAGPRRARTTPAPPSRRSTRYQLGDPTAVAGVAQEGAGA